MRGNEEPLGEDVDPGLLLQSSKDQRVWLEGLGDLANLELAIMVDFNSGRAQWLEVGGGVYPSQNSSCCSPLRPETPVRKAGDSGLAGDSGTSTE